MLTGHRPSLLHPVLGAAAATHLPPNPSSAGERLESWDRGDQPEKHRRH
jgi:hypothetical protein